MFFLNPDSSVTVQIDCQIRRNDIAKIIKGFAEADISRGHSKEKTTLVSSPYEISVNINDTSRAPDKRAIVRIDATIKIFSLRSSEYNPIAYNDVHTTLVKKCAGIKK